ncbi:uncharacterized protein WM294_012425 isoform 2-T3 [Sarcoramphus papa]
MTGGDQMEFVLLMSMAFKSQRAVQPVFCIASSRQSQVIDGTGSNLYESIKCLGKMKGTPGSLWHLSPTLSGRRRIPIAVQSLTWDGFCSQGVWAASPVSSSSQTGIVVYTNALAWKLV